MSAAVPPDHSALRPLERVAELPHQLLATAAGTAVHVVLGLLAGGLLARQMRRWGVHWSWAALALAGVLLACPRLSGVSLAIALAAFRAALLTQRWHRQDIADGGELARAAALRVHPLALLWALARRPPRCHGGGGVEMLLGRNERRREVRVALGDAGGGTHALVVGATGSGKTVTQTAMAVAAVRGGMGVIALDPKGDARMREQLALAAAQAGRAFHEWTPDGRCVYNPFASGGDTEIADRALAGERFTEPHYLRQAQRYLGHAVRVLRRRGVEVSLRTLVAHLEPERLEQLARELPGAHAGATFAYLDSLTSQQRTGLAGVRDRLAVLAESDVGPWLDPGHTGGRRLSLRGALDQRSVVYFRLDADTRPLLAQMLGAAIVADLQSAVAERQRAPARALVVIDEFAALAAEHAVRLFARARSAGVSLVLGTQELADLRLPGRERLLEQVLGNLSLLIAHRQVVPESAELVAALAGSEEAWRIARHSDGRTTSTRARRPLLDAARVTRLPAGWAVVAFLTDGRQPRVTRICA